MTSANEYDASTQAQLAAVAQGVRGTFQTVESMTESFIRQAILQGIYRPGDRLHQDAIAEVLGVSRMPVRASLRQLEAEGLLSIVPHRGAVVTVLKPDEIAEIYELRIMVESYLLARAIENLTPDDLNDLAALVEDLEDDTEDRVSSRLERRKAFYERLYQVADKPRAARLAQQLRAAVGRYLLLQRVHDEHAASHRRLLALLRKRDAEGANKWLVQHLNRVSARLQELVADEQRPHDEAAG